MEFVCKDPLFTFDLNAKPVKIGKNYLVCKDITKGTEPSVLRIYDADRHKASYKSFLSRCSQLYGKFSAHEFFSRYTLKTAPEFLSDQIKINTSQGERSFCAVRFCCPIESNPFIRAYSEANKSASLLTNLFMGFVSAVIELKTSIPEILGIDINNVWTIGTNPLFMDFVLDEKAEGDNIFLFSDFETSNKRQSLFNFFVAVYCFLDSNKMVKNIGELRRERNGAYAKILDEIAEKMNLRKGQSSDEIMVLGDFRSVLSRYIAKNRNHLPKIIDYVAPKSGQPMPYVFAKDILEKAYEIKDYNYNELELKEDYYSLKKNPNRKVRVNVTGKNGDPEYSFDSKKGLVVSGGDEICYGFKEKENNKPYIFNFQSEAAATFINTFNGRGILADQVGMGKTIEAGLIVSEYAARPERESRWHTLLIVSKTGESDDEGDGKLIKQWCDEMAEKFGLFVKRLERKNRNATANEYLLDRVAPLFENGKRRRTKPLKGIHDGGELCYPVCIISYQDFIKQNVFFRDNPKLVPPQIDMLIVDEAHQLITGKLLDAVERCVKNPDYNLSDDDMFSKSVALNLVRKLISKYCILLTATPHKGDLTMLYPYMKLLRQSERGYANISEFFRDVCKGCKTVKEFKNRYGAGALEEIRAMMRVIAVRNTRQSTTAQLDWQEKKSFVYYFRNPKSEMDNLAFEDLFVGNQKLAYKKSLNQVSEINVVNYSGADEALEEAKLDTLQSIARRRAKEKMIVFFDSSTVSEEAARRKRIKKELETRLKRRIFDDATEFENEETLFGTSNGILLADAKSSEGRNLQFCHVLVNFDILRCPMKMEQRIGRIDRIGQKEEMSIYSFGALKDLSGQLLAMYDNVLQIFSKWNGDIMYVAGSVFGGKEGDESDKGSIFEKRVTEIWKKTVKNGAEDYPEWSKIWNEKSELLARELDFVDDDILDSQKADSDDKQINLNADFKKEGGLYVVQKQSDFKVVDAFLKKASQNLFTSS